MTDDVLTRARIALERSNIPEELPDDVLEALALIDGEPEGVAERVIAALRFGSRGALESRGLIQPVQTSGPRAGEIVITDKGWRVIAACGAELDERPETEQEAQQEVDLAREAWLEESD